MMGRRQRHHGNDEWGIARYAQELVKQILTPEGLMLLASMYTCVRVLTAGPEWAAWPAIIWNAMMVFNRTGRWIVPDFIQKWFAAKVQNGGSAAAVKP